MVFRMYVKCLPRQVRRSYAKIKSRLVPEFSGTLSKESRKIVLSACRRQVDLLRDVHNDGNTFASGGQLLA